MNRRRTLLAGSTRILVSAARAFSEPAARKYSVAARHAAKPEATFATTTRTTRAAQAEALARSKR